MAGRPYRALRGGFVQSGPVGAGPAPATPMHGARTSVAPVRLRTCRSPAVRHPDAADRAVDCRRPASTDASCPCPAKPRRGARTSVTAGRSPATSPGVARERRLAGRPLSRQRPGWRAPRSRPAAHRQGPAGPVAAAHRQHQWRRCPGPARGPTACDWMAERPKPRCFRQVEDGYLVRSHRTGGVGAPEREHVAGGRVTWTQNCWRDCSSR